MELGPSGYPPLTSPVTRDDQTARQCHLSRGVYPVHYNEPRGIPSDKWQIDVDNRIRFGLKQALLLGIIKPEATVIAVQGWKGGLGHVSYFNRPDRVLTSCLDQHSPYPFVSILTSDACPANLFSVPTEDADLELHPIPRQ